MKHFAFIITLGIGMISYSQTSIQTDFNATYVGRNQSITVHQQWNNFSLYGGLKIHINKGYSANDGALLNKSAHAKFFAQHLGVTAGVSYNFLQLENMSLFAFFETQHTHANVIRETDRFIGTTIVDGVEEMIFTPHTVDFGPWWFSENNIGIGFKASIFKGLYLNGRAGIGLMTAVNFDPGYKYSFPGANLNATHQLSFGLGYTFPSKVK